MQLIPKIELATAKEIESFQLKKLKDLLVYINEKSPYYKRIFKEQNVDIQTVNSLDDLKNMPLTTKNDLQKLNDDFICVPKTEIIDYATTSGTLGVPVTIGLTDKDLDRLAYNEAISFQCAGIKKGDVVQLMTTMDRRFMAGLAYFLGLRKLGAGVIRVGAGIPQLQWDSIFKYKPKFLIGVPSFLLKLIDYAEKNGIDYNNSGIEAVVCVGETLRASNLEPNILANRINGKWNVKLHSTYASTEMGTAFTECFNLKGGHHHPELIITEILDENNNAVPDGELGELTITTLGVEAIPLLRFKTGDMVRRLSEHCSCGRNTYRLGPVEGRKQHMIKYKGTSLYPPVMHDLLGGFHEIKLHLIEISSNEIGTDDILLRLYSLDESPAFLSRIKDTFRAKLRVSPSIVFEKMEELQKIVFEPISRKPITFIDKRQQQKIT